MNWIRLIIVLFAAALAQATLVPALAIGTARPDLPLIFALVIAARIPVSREWGWRAFWVGWLAGLCVDIFSPGSPMPFGVTAIIYGLAAYSISNTGPEIFYDNAVSKVVVLGLACLGANAVLMTLHLLLGNMPRGAVNMVLWTSAYDAAIAPAAYAAIRPLNKFIGVRERRTFANV